MNNYFENLLQMLDDTFEGHNSIQIEFSSSSLVSFLVYHSGEHEYFSKVEDLDRYIKDVCHLTVDKLLSSGGM